MVHRQSLEVTFASVAAAFTKAVEALKATGDPLAQGDIHDQLLFLRLRERLVAGGFLSEVRRIVNQDSQAGSMLTQYLSATGRADIVTEVEAEVTRLSEALLDRPVAGEGKIRITDVAFEVLRETGHPLHFKDMLPLVIVRGAVIGGKNPADTLRAYIQRDRRFRRVPGERGVYQLA